MSKRLSELTIEDLRSFKYPNLMAEVKETTYSICTIAEHMGLPRPYRKEDDAETWNKLTGQAEVTSVEAIGVACLFGVNIDYLFSDELRVIDGETLAHWRWLDVKERNKKEREQLKQIRKIEKELRGNPNLLEIMRILITFDNEQLDEFISMIERWKSVKN